MGGSETPELPPADRGPSADDAAPIPAIFLCRFCRKGRLNPSGKKPGEEMACPACGKPIKVTLEHTLGEEHLARRQSAREAARVPFHALPEEKQLEILARKTGAGKCWYLLMYHLGPKGMVALYLGTLVMLVAALVSYRVVSRDPGEPWFQPHPWWYWLVAAGAGAGAGLLGFFGWVTFAHFRNRARGRTKG